MKEAVLIGAEGVGAKSIKIPQVLNGALAASVYICGAQELGPMAVRSNLSFADLDMRATWVAITIFLWTTKNFVDDYRAFDGAADKGFNLAFTVFFSAAAYVTLAISAASLVSGSAAARVLVWYFAVLVAWSACSWLRRKKIDEPTSEEKNRLKRRMLWMGFYAVAGMLTYRIATTVSQFEMLILAILVWGIYWYDAVECKTFSTENVEAA